MSRRIELVAIAGMLCALLIAFAPAHAQEATPPAEDSWYPTCAMHDSTPVAEEESDEEAPAWKTIELTDVRTDQVYTIEELAGCVVYVEPMATWCSSCRQQLKFVQEALPEIDQDRVVVIALSVETDLDPATLASYAEQSEFDFVFSVATEDMLRAIVDDFGRSAIVPPSTPHFIVAADGSVSDLSTGFVEPDDIIAKINETLEQ